MNRKHALLTAAAIAALLPLALALTLGQAGATPGSGVSTSIMARGTTDQHIHIRAKQPTELVFARVTVQPGGDTGWHTHPGPLLAVVESGTLTHYDSDCEVQTYRTGQAFEEPAGRRRVHMGANRTGAPVVLEITYVIPSGGPLRDEAPAPECADSL